MNGTGTAYAPAATFAISANTTLYAQYAINTYSLTTQATTGGSVTAPASSPTTVNYGAATTITAVASTGYSFTGWTVTAGTASIANASSLSTTVTLTSGNATVQANFAQITYQLTTQATTGGSVTAPASSPTTVNYGAATTITAVASTGYSFTGWTVTAGTASIANASSLSTTVTLTSGNATVQANFAQITYQLTTQATTGGSVTAPASSPTTVNYGAATTITAVASTGYSFTGWTVTAGTASIANASSLSTTVTLTSGNATVQANFAQITYQLTTQATTGGSVTAPASSPTTVNYGAATTITAVASTGYSFTGWTVTAGTASIANASSLSTTVTLTSGNATVQANFAQITYQLTTQATTGGTVTAPASSPTTVNYGAATTITAFASTGYSFTGWTVTAGTASIGNASSLSTTVTLTSGNATVQANFTINTYTLTYTAGANGTISGTTPQTVNYNASGTAVTAVANTGYHFVQWSDGSTANPRTDANVTANISVTASFTINTYTLTYTAGANGTISGTSPQTVNYNASGTAVTAVANTGYHFVQWSDGSTTNPRTDANVTANISVTASFAINTYTLTYTAGTNGSISGTTPQTVNYNASGTAVTAVANTGYHFVQWSDGSTTNPRTDANVTANISVTASFAINTYTLTYTAGTNGSISGTTPQTVNYGASGTAVTAVPNTGYYFVQWSDGSTANPRTDANVTANISVTASFAINTYTLTYTAGTNGSISGTTPQTVNYGASGTAVTAVPGTGYYFVQWSDGSTANPRTDANVTANISVIASFAAQTTPTLSVTNSPVTYNGSTQAASVSGSVAGTVSNVEYNGSLTVPKGAGTYAITANFVPTDNTHYSSLTNAPAGNFVINTATLTVTATGVNKVYDGTTVATVTLSDNKVAGDNVTDAYTTATFSDKNIGNGKTVSVSGISISGTDAGNYTLSNTTATTTANITPASLTITSNNITKCNGAAYTFAGTEFTTSGLQGSDAVSSVALTSTGAGAGATAGTYSIIITPGSETGTGLSNYNISYVNGTLTVEAPVAVTLTQVNPDCHGNPGSLTTNTVTGGISPYTYKLNTGAFDPSGTYVSNPLFGSLATGGYTYAVKDVNGCIGTQGATLSQLTKEPVLINNVAAPATVPVCYGGSTTITTNVVGGNPAFTYTLDSNGVNGSPQQSANRYFNVRAGSYYIIVTDSHGCSYTTNTIMVTQPSTALTLSSVVTNPTCTVPAGSITVTASGGYSSSYSYSDNGGSVYQGTGSFTGLSPATYNLAVKDNNGCVTIGTAVVSSKQSTLTTSAIMLGGSGSTQICYGATTTVSTTPSGGTAPYTYSLNSGTFYSSSSRYFAVVGAGTDSITVKDAGGCIVTTAPVTLTQPSSAVIFTDTVGNANCASTTGSIIVKASGGYGGYSYSDNNGSSYQGSSTFTGLGAGTYNVVVKDMNGCTAYNTATVKQPTFTTSGIVGNLKVCYGGSTSIYTVPSGGATPYNI